MTMSLPRPAHPSRQFADRHIGLTETDIEQMLQVIGAQSVEALIAETLPAAIRQGKPLTGMEPAFSEVESLQRLRQIGRTACRHLLRRTADLSPQIGTLPGKDVGQAGIANGYPGHAPSLIKVSIMSLTAWMTFALAA